MAMLPLVLLMKRLFQGSRQRLMVGVNQCMACQP